MQNVVSTNPADRRRVPEVFTLLSPFDCVVQHVDAFQGDVRAVRDLNYFVVKEKCLSLTGSLDREHGPKGPGTT